MPRNSRPDQRRSLNVFDRILDTILRDSGSSNSRRAQRRRERAQKEQQTDSAPLDGDTQEQTMTDALEEPEVTERENVGMESTGVESAASEEQSEALEDTSSSLERPSGYIEIPHSSGSSGASAYTAQETTNDSEPSVPSNSQHESESQDSQDAPPTTQSNPPHRHFHFFPIPRSLDGSSNDGDSSGTILITVNYVFSDNNNPQNPNRLGSLVMTFPDNASNRQPRIMQELVRYATLMAYRTIVSGLHKKVGTTVEKFNSFPIKHQDEGSVCSICFEEYESASEGEENREEGHCKRRRLNSPDPLSGDDVNYQASPNIDAPLLPQSPLPPVDTTEETSSRAPKYLSDDTTVYKHLPAELPCGHVFGRSCLNEWLKTNTTCPLCRQKVEEDTAPATISPANSPNGGTTPIVFLNGGRALNSSLDSLQNSQDNTNPGREGGVLSNILSYLRGPRESLFPQGVSSRRTETGVETTSDVVDYMNLGDLTRQAEQNQNEENEQENEQEEGHTEERHTEERHTEERHTEE